ncbi:MAG: DUF11 domain-containing protein [Solobacterium sp.]|nr:DUF11 domain-containing protein [Solobacterium sp.]
MKKAITALLAGALSFYSLHLPVYGEGSEGEDTEPVTESEQITEENKDSEAETLNSEPGQPDQPPETAEPVQADDTEGAVLQEEIQTEPDQEEEGSWDEEETLPEDPGTGHIIDIIYDSLQGKITLSEAESTQENILGMLPQEVNVHFSDIQADGTVTLLWGGYEYVEHTGGSYEFYPSIPEEYILETELTGYYEVSVSMDFSEIIAQDQNTVYRADQPEEPVIKKQSLKAIKNARGVSPQGELTVQEDHAVFTRDPRGAGPETNYGADTFVSAQKMLQGYTDTAVLSAEDPHSHYTDSRQKNYRSASDNTAEEYLYKSAEWEDIHGGYAVVNIVGAKQTESSGSHALYVFTDCPSHGFSYRKAAEKIQALLKRFDRVTLMAVDGPDDDRIIQKDVSGDPDSSDYYVNLLQSLSWRGGNHYSLNVYAALYRYFFGSYESTEPISRDAWPTAVYTQYDNLYEPCNYPAAGGMPAVSDVGVCDAYGLHGSFRNRYDSNGQAYALGNAGRVDSPIWDILQDYKKQGKYFSFALDGSTASKGHFSRWENQLGTPSASDKWRLNIIAGLAQPGKYDKATGNSKAVWEQIWDRSGELDQSILDPSASRDWHHVYEIPSDTMPDYSNVEEYDASGTYPQNFVINDTVSDDWEILGIEASKKNALIDYTYGDPKVSVTFRDYVPGEQVGVKIHLKAKFSVSEEWKKTNAEEAESAGEAGNPEGRYTYQKVASPVLTRGSYVLTIHYLEEGTDRILHESYRGVYNGDEPYEVPSPTIRLYDLADPQQETVNGTMPYADLELTVYYNQRTWSEPIPVKKIVEGNDEPTQTFRFQLTPEEEGYPMPEEAIISIMGNGEAEFGRIQFPQDGTYRYTIRELNDQQFGYLMDAQIYTVTFTVSNGVITRTITNESVEPASAEVEYGYTGEEATFTAPVDGYYTLEAWGAQGGTGAGGSGGQGGYAKGTIAMEKGETIYINVGGQGGKAANGKNPAGGYNGGGRGHSRDTVQYADDGVTVIGHDYRNGAAGGGATHFASESGLLSSLENQKNAVILVAGGGGGAGMFFGAGEKEDDPRSANWDPEVWKNSGKGGGLEGGVGGYGIHHHNSGGSQTSGYAFGAGQPADSGTGGGGGGWFGGRRFTPNSSVGSGGSGYIQTDTTLSELGIQPEYPLIDAETQQGGHTGNGLARISYNISNETDIAVFTNIYSEEDQPVHTAELKIRKTVEGEDIEEREITFCVESEDETAPMPEHPEITQKITEKETELSFGKIVFEKPGTYTYRVCEKKDPAVTQYTFGEALVVTYEVSEEGMRIKTNREGNQMTITNTWHLYDLKVTKTGLLEGDPFDAINFTVQDVTEGHGQYLLFEHQADGSWKKTGYTEETQATRLTLDENRELHLSGLPAGSYGIFEQTEQEGYFPELNGTSIDLLPVSMTDYTLSDASAAVDSQNRKLPLTIEEDTAVFEIRNIPDESEIHAPVKTVRNAAGEDIDGQYVNVGDTLYYRIEVENDTQVVRTYEVSDPLPKYTEFIQAENGGSLKGGIVIFPAFRLSPGERKTVSFTVLVKDAESRIDNTAEVRITGKPVQTNMVTNYTLTEPKKAVLDLSGRDIHQHYINKDEEYIYAVTVRNTAEEEKEFTIFDYLTDDIEFITAEDGGQLISAEAAKEAAESLGLPAEEREAVQWKIAVGAGEEKTVTFHVKAKKEGTAIKNQAYSAVEQTGAVPTNEVIVYTPLPPVKSVLDLEGKEINGKEVQAGEIIKYTIEVVNSLPAGNKEESETELEYRVTDEIPEGVEYLRSEDTDIQQDNETGTLSWSFRLKNGEKRILSWYGIVKPVKKASQIENEALEEILQGNARIRSNKVVNPVAPGIGIVRGDLVSVYKSSDPVSGSSVKYGESITYTLTAENTGISTSAKTFISDRLPEQVEYIEGSADHGGIYDAGSRTLKWELDGLEPGEKQAVTFKVIVRAEDAAYILNHSEYTSSTDIHSEETKRTNETVHVVGKITAPPVLEIHKSVDKPGVIKTGDILTYTMDLVNHGRTAAKDCVITDRIPEGTVFYSVTGGTYHEKKNRVEWYLGNLEPGERKSVSFSVKVTAEKGRILNQALFDWDMPEEQLSECEPANSSNITENWLPPKPVKNVLDAGGKSIDQDFVKAGETLCYTITIENTSPYSRKYTIKDTIPGQVSFVKADHQGALSENAVQWELSMKPGEKMTVSFEAKVREQTEGGQIRNEAQLFIDDMEIRSNEVINPVATDPVKAVRTLAGRDVDGQTLKAGERYYYEITAANPKKEKQDVKISDRLPQGIRYISSSDQGYYRNGEVTWELSLAGGETKTVRIVFTPLNQNAIFENKAAVTMGRLSQETNTVKNRVETEIKTYPTGVAGRNLILPIAAILGSVVLAAIWIKKRKG